MINKKLLALGLSLPLLAACQSTGPAYQQPNRTYQPLMTPAMSNLANRNNAANQKKVWGDSSSSTKRYVRPDGTRVTETTKTSANVSINKAAAANAIGGLVLAALGGGFNQQPARPQLTPQQLAGTWRLYETSGSKSCTIQLKTMSWFGAYQAMPSFNCPGGLFGSLKWNYLGNQIMLMNTQGQMLARFNQKNANHWQGSFLNGGTAVTLAR